MDAHIAVVSHLSHCYVEIDRYRNEAVNVLATHLSNGSSYQPISRCLGVTWFKGLGVQGVFNMKRSLLALNIPNYMKLKLKLLILFYLYQL